MRLIVRYIWRHKKFLWFNLIGVAGFVLIQIGIPTVLKQILNDVLPNQMESKLRELVLFMVIFALVGFFGQILLAFSTSKISTNVVKDLRNDLFDKTQHFSNSEFEKHGISSLITSTTSDSFQIMLFTQMLLRNGFLTPAMAISGIIMAFRSSPTLSIWILGAVPFVIIGVIIIGRFSEPLSKKQQGTLDKINLLLRENLTGLRVIRAFNNEEFVSERFEEENQTYSAVSRKVFRLTTLASPSFFFLFSMLIIILLWVGANQMSVNINSIEPGTLAILIEYVFHILYSTLMACTLVIMYPRASVSAKRIEKILNSKITIESPEDGVTHTDITGELAFRNVTFAYPEDDVEEPVLRDISFTAQKGQTVAFIGSTGSGKSTLVQLIPRIHDVTKGEILVDGIDIRKYELDALRNKIGFIPQKAILFTGTIKENLRFGKSDASEAEIYSATDIAQATEFINSKEKGLDEYLSEGGSNLSGGQKQRLAIARAIVKRPEIYIFDDSFSALDYQTDKKLRTALREKIKDATILVVAQRVGTIIDADKIIVLNNGRIVAEGTHQKLLKSSKLYYDIAASQLTGEELGL